MFIVTSVTSRRLCPVLTCLAVGARVAGKAGTGVAATEQVAGPAVLTRVDRAGVGHGWNQTQPFSVSFFRDQRFRIQDSNDSFHLSECSHDQTQHGTQR